MESRSRLIFIVFLMHRCVFSYYLSTETETNNLLVDSLNWAKHVACSVHENDYIHKPTHNNQVNSIQFNVYSNESSYETTPISTIFSESNPKTGSQQLLVSFKLNLQGTMSVEESLYLLYLNMANDLQHNQLPVHPQIKWKQTMMNLMSQILAKACPNEYVSTSFMHVVKELFLHYQTQLQVQFQGHDDINTSQSQEDTEDSNKDEEIVVDQNISSTSGGGQLGNKILILSALTECADKAVLLDLTGSSGLVNRLRVKNQKKYTQEIQIKPPKEDADDEFRFGEKDHIIDSAWWIFSFIFGYCFPNFQHLKLVSENTNQSVTDFNSNDLLQEILSRFFSTHFLTGLKTRWMNVGKYATAFSTIIGKLNTTVVARNLRYCVTAAYISNNIEEYQLVRPISFHFQNSKIGPHVDPF